MKVRFAAIAIAVLMGGNALGPGALAQTETPQIAAVTGAEALSAETIAALKATPATILQTYPAGGAVMIAFVAKAVASDIALLEKFLSILDQATPLQVSAIGFGLARAASQYEAAGLTDQVQAIADAVAATGNQRLIEAFDEGSGAPPGAISQAPGAPGAPGGPVGTSTSTTASNADDTGGGDPGAGIIAGGGLGGAGGAVNSETGDLSVSPTG